MVKNDMPSVFDHTFDEKVALLVSLDSVDVVAKPRKLLVEVFERRAMIIYSPAHTLARR